LSPNGGRDKVPIVFINQGRGNNSTTQIVANVFCQFTGVLLRLKKGINLCKFCTSCR